MGDKDPFSRVDYRRLIAWPQRIQREWPFLEDALASVPTKRLLDLGCGTGEHARFLVGQGYEVVGIDRSESMLDKARDEPLPPGLEFVLGDISEVERLTCGTFGGAICLGNTLPHLRSGEELSRLFRGLKRRLEPGGLLILQILNYQPIFDRHERQLPLNFRPDDDGEIVFLRLMDPRDDGSVVFCPSTLRFRPDREPPLELISSKRVVLRGWCLEEIDAVLTQAGFGERQAYGDYDGSPFAAPESRDLILVARYAA